MSEFGLENIIESVRYSNECEEGHSKCSKGLKQRCLGDTIGLNPQMLCKLATGRIISFRGATIICEYFGLKVEDYTALTNIGLPAVGGWKIPELDITGDRADVKRIVNGFRAAVVAARMATACDNGCCKDYLSMSHCGAIFGLVPTSWRNIEVGKGIIRLELFLLICNYFELDPRNYIGSSVSKGGGHDDEAINWISSMKGRLAFDVDGEPVQIFVPGHSPCYGDTVVEAVAWMKRKIEDKKKVA